MVRKIIYVLADARSGSTLLDQLLGAHDEILSLGEVHHLVAYARQDRSLYDPVHPLMCLCGRPISACNFWRDTERQLERPLESLMLTCRVIDKGGNGRQATIARRIVRKLLVKYPQLCRHPAIARFLLSSRVGSDSFALFDAIFARHRNIKYLVDSSKSPFRFRALYDLYPERMVALVLARDYRGTIYSKVKRGCGLEESAKSWARRMFQIKTLTSDLPAQQLVRVRYEDLCADPRGELGRICERLDVSFSEVMQTRPTSNVHHLGGSPSKFDPGKVNIKLDTSYSSAFCDEELAFMRKIAGEAGAEWGYH